MLHVRCVVCRRGQACRQVVNREGGPQVWDIHTVTANILCKSWCRAGMVRFFGLDVSWELTALHRKRAAWYENLHKTADFLDLVSTVMIFDSRRRR